MNSKTENYKRFFIHTLGCKVNQYESQAMRENLLRSGFKECLSREMADIYIINTCTVTEHADKESRHMISLLHKTNPSAKIVVTGCYVEKDADDLSFLPGIAHIVRNHDKGRIASILAKTEHKVQVASHEFITGFKDHTKAFVKIQDGCDNHCAYCKVPLVRPNLLSKPIDTIRLEVKTLAENGFKEIVLTGICLGSWGKDIFAGMPALGGLGNAGLIDVLKAIDSIPGDFRIRLSSLEPLHVTDELIEFMTGNRRMCRHLHIPLQSGDDDVLQRMNRPYSSSYYRKLVEKVRKRIEDMAVTTDVLIGFPGESDENFMRTVAFVKDVMPARTHIFSYSRRKGTAAYAMADEIPHDVLKKRYHELNAAALGTSYLYRHRFLGKELDLLVESARHRRTGLLAGYSGNYIKVMFEGPDELMRKIIPVRVTDMNLTYTMGEYEK